MADLENSMQEKWGIDMSMRGVMKHKELIDIAHSWVLKKASCGIAFRDIRHIGSSEICDVLGLGSGDHSVLIEVKVSRSDFLADKKKPFRQNPEFGIGKFRYYCCPKGLINISDLPKKWGLLWVENNKIEVIVDPFIGRYNLEDDNECSIFFDRNQIAERSIMYSILRRLQLDKKLTKY